MNEIESLIIEDLEKYPIHDRYFSVDNFLEIIASIAKDNKLEVNFLDCMKLYEKFRDYKWVDGKWFDWGGCLCFRCSNHIIKEYKMRKEWYEKYRDCYKEQEWHKLYKDVLDNLLKYKERIKRAPDREKYE